MEQMGLNPNQLMVLQNPGMMGGQMGGMPMLITPMVVTPEQMEQMKKSQAGAMKTSSSKDSHHDLKTRDRSHGSVERRHHSSSHRFDSKRDSRDYHKLRDDRHDSRSSRHGSSHRSPSGSHHSSSRHERSRDYRSRDYSDRSYDQRTRSSSSHHETRPLYSDRESSYRGRSSYRPRGTYRGRRGYDNHYSSTSRYSRDEATSSRSSDYMRSQPKPRDTTPPSSASYHSTYEPRGSGRGRGAVRGRGRGYFAGSTPENRRPAVVTRSLATSIVRKYTTTPRLTTRGRFTSTRGFYRGMTSYRGRGTGFPRAGYNNCTLCKIQFYGTRAAHSMSVEHQRNVRARKHAFAVALERRRQSDDDGSPGPDMEDLVILDSVGESDEEMKEEPKPEKGSDSEEQKLLHHHHHHHHHASRKRRRLIDALSGSASQNESAPPAKPLHTIEIVPPDPSVDQYGACYIIPVSGFFCKLCCKFYHNEAAAKRVHIKSSTHLEKLKTARSTYEKKLAAEKEAEKVAAETTAGEPEEQTPPDSSPPAVTSSTTVPKPDTPTPKMTVLQKMTTKTAKAVVTAKMAAATSQVQNRGTVLKKTATTRVTKIPAVLSKRMTAKRKAARSAANAQEVTPSGAEVTSAEAVEELSTPAASNDEAAAEVDSTESPTQREEDMEEVVVAVASDDAMADTTEPNQDATLTGTDAVQGADQSVTGSVTE
ncbi:uncharacterized protein LOC135501332 isoform X2 [Lineus longissimus]|uniref:uncharacterized protein LOC135501332 isoform X2 n=1 Tax=Lineus longissimus TaxID=88925 RepID=UPI00315C92CC